MFHKRVLVLLFSMLWWTGAECYASEITKEVRIITRDSQESINAVKKEKRFVAVPIPISDPTVGTGLAVAGLYLHPQKEKDTISPTSISGVFGMYTETDSWMAGIFHNGFYMEDRYRIGGTLGYGEFNLKFYGIGEDSVFQDDPVDYKAKGTILTPRLLFHLPWDNWFLGARFFYLNIETSFDFSDLLPGLPEIGVTTQTVGLGPTAVYDSRDNTLWASEGTLFEFTVLDYGEYLGSDFDYRKYSLKFIRYFPVSSTVTLAGRLDGQFNDGVSPFYDSAGLNLRGFPSTRYINTHAVTAQGEARWNFYKKWTALVFGGAGRTAEDVSGLGSAPTRYAWGGGIRYLIAEKQKLNIGLDITYGDDKVEFYIQIGDWFAN